MRGPDHRTENIALAVLALIVAMIAAYALATNKPMNDKEQDLAARLPANYETTLAALIRAGGNDCDRVCGAELAADNRTIRAACAAAAKQTDCANALNFDIVVTPAVEPTR